MPCARRPHSPCPHARTADPHTPELPRGSALIPFVTPRPPPSGPVTPGSSPGSLEWPHRPTLVFSAHFVLTGAHPGRTSRSVTHPQIALGQARLTFEFFVNELPEQKLQLVICV